MSENEKSRLISEIESDLREKSTEDLYRIWKAHDQSEWTEEFYRDCPTNFKRTYRSGTICERMVMM